MSCKDKITIDGVDYHRAETTGEKMMIVVADNRGLTFVGKIDLAAEGDFIPMRDARCVIRWGTSKHLAELAAKPLANTKLGAALTVRLNAAQIVAAYDCGEGWNNA